MAGKKTTAKDVAKAANKVNSYSALKKLMKVEEVTIREEAKPIVAFIDNIMNNRLTSAQIQKSLFE